MFKHILMVCTGNICRSPTAEAILRSRLGENVKGRTVASLGTMAMIGEPAHPLTFEVALERGIDLSGHHARQATKLLLSQADLILALDRGHESWMVSRYPELKGRVHLLGRWDGNQEVADPYGFPREASVKAFEQIEKYVETWLPRIVA
ncbi:MAG: low molecular weight protein-tyrosine-phosphatase [Pseudomonadota bacterium]